MNIEVIYNKLSLLSIEEKKKAKEQLTIEEKFAYNKYDNKQRQIKYINKLKLLKNPEKYEEYKCKNTLTVAKHRLNDKIKLEEYKNKQKKAINLIINNFKIFKAKKEFKDLKTKYINTFVNDIFNDIVEEIVEDIVNDIKIK